MPDELSNERPDLRKIGFSIMEIAKILFADWNPMPDIAYARKVGWPVNEDGTITTPGMGRVPSSELCDEVRIADMLKLEDNRDISELEELYKLGEDDNRI